MEDAKFGLIIRSVKKSELAWEIQLGRQLTSKHNNSNAKRLQKSLSLDAGIAASQSRKVECRAQGRVHRLLHRG